MFWQLISFILLLVYRLLVIVYTWEHILATPILGSWALMALGRNIEYPLHPSIPPRSPFFATFCQKLGSSKCVLFWFFSIQLLKKTYSEPRNYSFVSIICSKNENDLPPFRTFPNIHERFFCVIFGLKLWLYIFFTNIISGDSLIKGEKEIAKLMGGLLWCNVLKGNPSYLLWDDDYPALSRKDSADTLLWQPHISRLAWNPITYIFKSADQDSTFYQ